MSLFFSRDLVPLDVLEQAIYNPQPQWFTPMTADLTAAELTPSSDSAPPPSPKSETKTEHSSVEPPPSHKCLWVECTQSFVDPEVLYNHLCNDHIGRKSTNNLCLTCKWKDCGTSCAKRDHITSHLRGASYSYCCHVYDAYTNRLQSTPP